MDACLFKNYKAKAAVPGNENTTKKTLSRDLYLPCHVIQHIDLGQDSNRLAVFDDDQGIP